MATKRQQQIEELKKITAEVLEDDAVSVKEFAVFVDTVVGYLKNLTKDQDQVLTEIRQTLKDAASKVESGLEGSLKSKFEPFLKKMNELADKAQAKINETKDGYTPVKGTDYSDGEDADPEEVAKIVLERLTPKGMTPVEREAFEETLRDLLNMRDEIERLKKQGNSIAGAVAGIAGSGRSVIKDVDLSGSLDGSTKSFNIGAFYSVISVVSSSHPYPLRKLIDYTTDGNLGTITFTSQIDETATLAAGQTLILTVINA